MKFEKFFKSVGTHFNVLEGGWIQYQNLLVKIPVTIQHLFTEHGANMPEYAEEVLDEFSEDYSEPCEISGARLPYPEARAKDIERVFRVANGTEISISNSVFSLIESGDSTELTYDDDEGAKALIVSSGYGDKREVTMVVFDENYFMEVQ